MLRKAKIGTKVKIVTPLLGRVEYAFSPRRQKASFDKSKADTGVIVDYSYPGRYKILLDAPNFGTMWFRAKELVEYKEAQSC